MYTRLSPVLHSRTATVKQRLCSFLIFNSNLISNTNQLWLSHATHLLFLWQTDRGCGRWPTWCTYYYHTVIFPEFRLHSHIVISPASEVLRRRRVLSDSASGWHGEQIIGVADNIFVVADERINDSAVVAPCACATTSEPPGCT